MTHPDAPAPPPRSTLVVTAHAGDFVWRAGGAIALAAARGEKVTIACLTFGERGESAKAWREGKSLEEIKAIRRDEAEQAAATLGAQVRFFDAGDYPLVATPELTDQLVAVYRETQPDVVLTHPVQDPYNGDHPAGALGITPGQAGDLGSYATFGMLVGALTAGTVADRIGRKKLMVGCVTLFSLASGICALSGSVAVFGLGRTLAGVGLGGLLPTAISMVSDYARGGRAARPSAP
jgi:hypothetical protein